ncbi:Dam family site-specific DNA-(adenine-N6)-methyltransferase [Leptospira santarosai]|uniref:Dam family site-specific DNA-(adenine-N6)-methyltransferase n=1 Tax=Leptospira santarosai TaxID=28183 RepID=UPI0024AED608|nr:Dam family site-specific DNA-(adenine-N6)-methyltransferase [Leptospira santarosai]MDI7227875.1 Dam family site-specific DNA-(adenine-N6)-methyltransferase [Leptospira santarosai]
MSFLFPMESQLVKSPLKGQLLKWIGNKQKYADTIISYFPKKIKTYHEPFLGSGAVIATLSPQKGIGSDIFKPLIDIFQKLKSNPDELILDYADNYALMEKFGKEKAYEIIKSSYNLNPNSKDLLFLSRSCYGGVVRFRKADGYMSTPCGIHNPLSPKSFAERVYSWRDRVANCEFFNLDYKDVFDSAEANDLIYCDPPYKDSQAILYGAQSFSLNDLYDSIENAKLRGVNIALSIDGSKKSGSKIIDIQYPKGLFQSEIPIVNGRSMLKRFQMAGQTLEEEVVTERLLLTYKI